MPERLADSEVELAPGAVRTPPWFFNPAVAFVVSGVLWGVGLAGTLNNPRTLSEGFSFRIPNPKGDAWFFLSLAALFLALACGITYMFSAWLRRPRHQPPHLASQRAHFTSGETVAGISLLAFTVLAVERILRDVGHTIALRGWEGLLVLTASNAWSFGAYAYHLVVLPITGAALLFDRRNRRRQPEKIYREHSAIGFVIGVLLLGCAGVAVGMAFVELYVTVGDVPSTTTINL